MSSILSCGHEEITSVNECNMGPGKIWNNHGKQTGSRRLLMESKKKKYVLGGELNFGHTARITPWLLRIVTSYIYMRLL